MPRPRSSALLRTFVFLPLTLLPATARASLIVPVTEQQMARRAAVIVTGTVRSVESRWNETHDYIYTDVVLGVDQYLKGGLGRPQIVVTVDGGQVGEVSLEAQGAPVFEPGERVLLFLMRDASRDLLTVYGLSYGKYEIYRDPALQADVVSGPSFYAATHYDLATLQPVAKRSRPEKVRLADFLAEVRRYVGAER